MSRCQRQIDELRDLCRAGAVARAVDLAFGHFSEFGRDEDIIDLLATAMAHAGDARVVRQRFSELQAWSR